MLTAELVQVSSQMSSPKALISSGQTSLGLTSSSGLQPPLSIGEFSEVKSGSILDSINELKAILQEDERYHAYDASTSHGPDTNKTEVLFGGSKYVRMQEILATIPLRPIADQLISNFFTSVEIAPIILHSPTFSREYNRFWEHPDETSILWVGMLFGMMCLTLLHQECTLDESSQYFYSQMKIDPEHLIHTYREKVSRCLIIGDYTIAAPYTIETLLLYMHIEYLQKDNVQTTVWCSRDDYTFGFANGLPSRRLH